MKTDGEIPKSKMKELMKLLSACVVEQPLPLGSVVLKNVLGTGVNVVTTTEMTH
ncbi:MAG: DUF1667 domain-containing protein [Candidatus Fimimonas sp.]